MGWVQIRQKRHHICGAASFVVPSWEKYVSKELLWHIAQARARAEESCEKASFLVFRNFLVAANKLAHFDFLDLCNIVEIQQVFLFSLTHSI